MERNSVRNEAGTHNLLMSQLDDFQIWYFRGKRFSNIAANGRLQLKVLNQEYLQRTDATHKELVQRIGHLLPFYGFMTPIKPNWEVFDDLRIGMKLE